MDNEDRDPVFYYSRERRLSRASQRVRDLYEGKPVRPGFSRTLFGTKGNVMIFVTIMIICGILFGTTSRFSGKDRGIKLGGNTLTVKIFREDGIPILSIVKNSPKTGEVYLGAVDIAVSPVMPKTKDTEPVETPPVFTHRIYFNPVDSESFMISLPFTESGFYVILKTGDEQKVIKL